MWNSSAEISDPHFFTQVISFSVKSACNLKPSPKLQTVKHTAVQSCSPFLHLSSRGGGTHSATSMNDIQELGLLKIQPQLLETSPKIAEAQMAGTQGDCWMKRSGKNVILKQIQTSSSRRNSMFDLKWVLCSNKTTPMFKSLISVYRRTRWQMKVCYLTFQSTFSLAIVKQTVKQRRNRLKQKVE